MAWAGVSTPSLEEAGSDRRCWSQPPYVLTRSYPASQMLRHAGVRPALLSPLAHALTPGTHDMFACFLLDAQVKEILYQALDILAQKLDNLDSGARAAIDREGM